MDIDSLLTKVRSYLPEEKVAVIEKAYRFAAEAHKGQLRKSGEPFIQHPLETAAVLAGLELDGNSIAAALLHDVIEDGNVPLDTIRKEFSDEIARLVDGITKLSKFSWSATNPVSPKDVDKSEAQAENVRKMLVAMAEDIRVVFIKLADRLHNMRTIDALSPEKVKRIAQETLDIYTPLASRLGIWELKSELEDLAFRHLDPERYEQVMRFIERRGATGREFIERATAVLKDELKKNGITADVSGRPKTAFSIHLKMEKYISQGKDPSEIYDVLAVRVLVDKVSDCYNVLGTVHSLWHPLPGSFDDYISSPKENGYQSLHTVVMCFGTTPLEIQIRTFEMHRIAEYGVAAHWQYKEGAKVDLKYQERISWLRQLVEWHKELRGASEFLESVKTDVFKDQVFVYTPKGEIKEFPTGSTPLDFAYRVHTNLGHSCIGAKVNGRLVPLNYALNNGDTIEIITTKTGKGPSLDWLNPNSGFVYTSHAKDKIRQWFKKQERTENVERGRAILDKELKRLGFRAMEHLELAKMFRLESADELYAAIGSGDVTPSQIALKLAQEQETQEPAIAPEKPATEREQLSAVQVLGVGDLLTRLARCCNPVPRDDIVGYVTRSRGITVHRRSCPNIVHEDEKERIISVDWGRVDRVFSTTVRIEAWDRVGLLRDISAVFASEGVNISSLNVTERPNGTASIILTMATTGLEQLGRLLTKVEGIHGVISASRSLDGSK